MMNGSRNLNSLIIIPTYNEKDNIKPLCESIFRFAPQTEVLIVDDASPDGTGSLVEEMKAEDRRVHVLHRLEKGGLGSACVSGFSWGLGRGFDPLIQIDADFSHNPRYLPTMLDLLRHYDGVIGSRYITLGGTLNWDAGRRLLSWSANLYARLVLGTRIRDLTGGFNGWTKRALLAVELRSLRSKGYAFEIELKHSVLSTGLKMIEFPIIFEERRLGESKLGGGIALEAALRVWLLRFQKRKKPEEGWVGDGIRTHGHRGHNPVL